MDRHVRRVGDEVAVGVEDGARKIETLLDVHRVRGIGERDAHLFRDRHEEVVEDFEQHRIGGGADRVRALRRFDPLDDEVIARRKTRAPPRLDHRGGIPLADDRGSGNGVAWTQIGTVEHEGIVKPSVRVHAIRLERRQRARAWRELRHEVRGGFGPADGLDRDCLDDERLARHQKAVLLLVAALEVRENFPRGRRGVLPQGGVRLGAALRRTSLQHLRAESRASCRCRRISCAACAGTRSVRPRCPGLRLPRAPFLPMRQTPRRLPPAPLPTTPPRPPAGATPAHRPTPFRRRRARLPTGG